MVNEDARRLALAFEVNRRRMSRGAEPLRIAHIQRAIDCVCGKRPAMRDGVTPFTFHGKIADQTIPYWPTHKALEFGYGRPLWWITERGKKALKEWPAASFMVAR